MKMNKEFIVTKEQIKNIEVEKSNLLESLKNEGVSDLAISEVIIGFVDGFDLTSYAREGIDASCLNAIRMGMRAGIDTKIYSKKEFDFEQMVAIRDGLIEGIDAELYADSSIDSSDMMRMKANMINNKYSDKYNLLAKRLGKKTEVKKIESVKQALMKFNRLKIKRLGFKRNNLKVLWNNVYEVFIEYLNDWDNEWVDYDNIKKCEITLDSKNFISTLKWLVSTRNLIDNAGAIELEEHIKLI